MTKSRDSFIIYRSFIEAIKNLPDEERLKIFDAISDYALDEKECNLEGISHTVFTLIKPQLEANRRRFENGCKKKKKSKTEAKRKQTKSKPEANVNVNHNLNQNVNLNPNPNENQNEENNIYQELSEGLRFVLENKLNKKISVGKGWSDEIRKLVLIDLKERKDAVSDVKNAINAISDHYGKEFFAVIESAKSLRAKFSKIESYLSRQNKNKGFNPQEIMDLDLES